MTTKTKSGSIEIGRRIGMMNSAVIASMSISIFGAGSIRPMPFGGYTPPCGRPVSRSRRKMILTTMIPIIT